MLAKGKSLAYLLDIAGKAVEASTGGNGFTVVAHALAKVGVKNIYGVIGIPVTELASAAQVLALYKTPPKICQAGSTPYLMSPD